MSGTVSHIPAHPCRTFCAELPLFPKYCYRLEPPYEELLPARLGSPIVGMVLLADLASAPDQVAVVRDLATLAAEAPDAPICLLVPDGTPTPGLLAALEPLGLVAFIFAAPGSGPPRPTTVLDAARALTSTSPILPTLPPIPQVPAAG